jgi:hypothetical protein
VNYSERRQQREALRQEARREAYGRASAMLMAAVNEPWEPVDLIAARGEDYVEQVTVEIIRLAGELTRKSG